MGTNLNQMAQFIEMVNQNKNPQQFVMNMLEEKANQNPIFQNLAVMVKSGNTQGVEDVVRNIARERGIDFDKEFNSFKQMFRR